MERVLLNNLLIQYRLTVIQDGEVPLAAGDMLSGNRFFPATMTVIAVLLLLAGVLAYGVRCRRCQKRILQLLGEQEFCESRWNLWKLKETIAELEWNILGNEV